MGGGSSDDRRRRKAAIFLLACALAGVLPHGLGPLGRLLPALGLAGLLGAYAVRTVFLRPPGEASFTTTAEETAAEEPSAEDTKAASSGVVEGSSSGLVAVDVEIGRAHV